MECDTPSNRTHTLSAYWITYTRILLTGDAWLTQLVCSIPAPPSTMPCWKHRSAAVVDDAQGTAPYQIIERLCEVLQGSRYTPGWTAGPSTGVLNPVCKWRADPLTQGTHITKVTQLQAAGLEHLCTSWTRQQPQDSALGCAVLSQANGNTAWP